MKGKNYCHNCGSPTHEEAIICVNCGVGLKKGKSVDTVNFIESWSRFSYSNYILILLFSLMPFLNLKCAGDKVESVTGLNMAVGAEREYLDTKTYYNIYGYEQERYVTKKESLFSWDICLFYITIIISLIVLLGSKSNKFKVARGWTIAALILLAEWFIVVSIRINKIAGRAIEISWGSGFWLTLILTTISFILLSIYLKRQKESEVLSENIYPPQINETENIQPKTTSVHQEQEVQIEPKKEALNYEQPNIQQSAPIVEEIIFEDTSKNKNKYVIILLLAIIFILGILYLLQREKSAVQQTNNNLVTPDTIAKIQPPTNNQSIQSEQSLTSQSQNYTARIIQEDLHYLVSSNKAYFYSSPDEENKRNAYLVANESIQACCSENGFVYTQFTNENGKTSEGWIKVSDLTEIDKDGTNKSDLKISAYLIYDDGSLSSFNLIDNKSLALWNTIIGEGQAEKSSTKTKVIIEGSDDNISLVIKTKKVKKLEEKNISLIDKKEFTIDDTGCDPLFIQIFKNGSALLTKEIPFACGE